MEKSLVKKRYYNIDLLKIVSIIMVLCLHYVGKGKLLAEAPVNSVTYFAAWIIEYLCLGAVNCFALCTGYLSANSKFRPEKLIALWFQVFFFHVLGAVIAYGKGLLTIDKAVLLKILFPIFTDQYWYVTAYFIFYLVSPLLVFIVQNVSLRKLKIIAFFSALIFGLNIFQWTVIRNGYHFVWFIALFFIAAYVKKANAFNRKSYVYFLLYIAFALLTFAFRYTLDAYGLKYFEVFNGQAYNFPTTFISSFMLFLAFKNINIKERRISKALSFLSKHTLGIYILHLNVFVLEYYYLHIVRPTAYMGSPLILANFAIYLVGTFLICLLLDVAREYLFKIFRIDKLSVFIALKLKTFFKSIIDYSPKKIDKTLDK